MFDGVVTHLYGQKDEISQLRAQLQQANQQTVDATRKASSQLAQTLEEENMSAEAERDQLLSQIKVLMEESRQRQFGRLKGKFDCVKTDVSSSGDALEHATTQHDRHVDEWVFRSEQFAKDVNASRDEVKTKMQNDWEAFDHRNVSIQKATESVHEETVRIVDAQMKDMGKQMGALDDFVAKARSQNGRFHDAHLYSLNSMGTNVRQSYSIVREQLEGLGGRVGELQNDSSQHKDSLLESTAPLSNGVRKPLSELRANIQARPLKEYIPIGITPQKRRYEYPSTLPQTESHEAIVSRLRNTKQLTALPFNGEEKITPLNSSSPTASPSKGFVYNDTDDEVGTEPPAPTTTTPSNTGLREVDANVVTRPVVSAEDAPASASASGRLSSPSMKRFSEDAAEDGSEDKDMTAADEAQPPTKRHCSTAAVTENKLPQKLMTRKMAEGRENVPPSASGGRRLRNRPSP